MWMIFDEAGNFVYSMSREPNPIDVAGRQVIESEDLDFENKKYTLKDGKIVGEDFVHPPPPPVEEPTVAQKLASVGITLDDLKKELGL